VAGFLAWPAELLEFVSSATHEALLATVQQVTQHFSSAYPASLFKNASKCRELKKGVAEALQAASLT